MKVHAAERWVKEVDTQIQAARSQAQRAEYRAKQVEAKLSTAKASIVELTHQKQSAEQRANKNMAYIRHNLLGKIDIFESTLVRM